MELGYSGTGSGTLTKCGKVQVDPGGHLYKSNGKIVHNCAVPAEIVVEVAQLRCQRHKFDSCCLCSVGQYPERHVTCRIPVARDIEALECPREQDGGEMGRRSCGCHRHGWQNFPQRQHGLDAFACDQYFVRSSEPDRVAENVAHGPAR